MRWSDEHYVKLYSRDTPTWKAMCWQAKALLPLLMRKLDKAGLLECGDLGRSAVGLMVDLPEEVVTPGIKDLERLKVVAWHGNVLEMTKFEEAQEARKSDVLKKRDERQKAKDRVKAEGLTAQTPAVIQPLSHHVTAPGVSSHHVPLQPSPARPQPDPDPALAPNASRPPLVLEGEAPKKAKKPTDPRWKSLVEALCADYLAVHGKAYRWQEKDGAALSSLLKAETPDEIRCRWGGALRASGWLCCTTVAQLGGKWNDLVGFAPAKPVENEPEPEFTDSPAGQAWRRIWARITSGPPLHSQHFLARITALALVEGATLELGCPDEHFQMWAKEHFHDVLSQHAIAIGLDGVLFAVDDTRRLAS